MGRKCPFRWVTFMAERGDFMKKLGKQTVFDQLCVLQATNADTERTGRFQGYIAFGDWTDNDEGICVRFHGGTPFSGHLDHAPVMHFDIYGDCKFALSMWMNKHNCPNLYDEEYISQITAFIQRNLPILYLVYDRYLDKEDALAYFEGKISYEKLLSSVYRIAEELYAGLLTCQNNAQLHIFCVQHQIYGTSEINSNRPILCSRLEQQLHPAFEISWEGECCTLCKYNGNSETVHIPENVEVIGKNAFCGHSEIKKLVFTETLETVEVGAFRGCSGIDMLTFPSSIWQICEEAFAECTQLRVVCFEQSALHEVYLEKGAFRSCVNLSEIYLPSFAIPEGNPFCDCSALMVYCKAGSFAEQYARDKGIPYSLTF